MRIRTQLFAGTAALVLALVGIQAWLQTRQVLALERELADVVTSVGEVLLLGRPGVPPVAANGFRYSWQSSDAPPEAAGPAPGAADPRPSAGSPPSTAPPGRSGTVLGRRVVVRHEASHQVVTDDVHAFVVDGGSATLDPEAARALSALAASHLGAKASRIRHVLPSPDALDPDGSAPFELELRVETLPEGPGRVLVISGKPGGEQRLPLPASRTADIVQATLRQGLAASAVLLLGGLLVAALFAQRLGGPLRRLALAAEALGRGELGTQVAAGAPGELGELESSFNRMSARLAELEAEQRAWRAREHLAELGDLSRGLAHTLRNPLHTLGLVVEELAAQDRGAAPGLVATARGQIRRIDRWLRSFLSLGAGRAAAPELVELGDLARDVALEAAQHGASVQVEDAPAGPLRVRGVAPALRAALANLVDNAVAASPPDEPVRIRLSCAGPHALIAVEDRGPGLPPEVRERLYAPHVTTKVDGSGMGLFLARQLVEGGHGGALELLDAPRGGTVALVRLPLEPAPDAAEPPA